MTIQATPLFFKIPIQKLVRDVDAPTAKIGTFSEPIFLFGGKTLETAQYGLTADLDAPEGRFWSQLLFSPENNIEMLVPFLASKGFIKFEWASITDWDGNPIFDINLLRALVIMEIRRRKRRAKYRPRKFLISGSGIGVKRIEIPGGSKLLVSAERYAFDYLKPAPEKKQMS